MGDSVRAFLRQSFCCKRNRAAAMHEKQRTSLIEGCQFDEVFQFSEVGGGWPLLQSLHLFFQSADASPLILCPKNSSSLPTRQHFSGWSFRPAAATHSRACWRDVDAASKELQWSRVLSMYTSTLDGACQLAPSPFFPQTWLERYTGQS